MMSWFTELLGLGNRAKDEARVLPAMEAEARSPRAGKQQRCSYCDGLGHKRPSHAAEIEDNLRNTIAELEAGKAAAEEQADLNARESRVLQEMIDDLRVELAYAQSIAQIGTYGEGTRI